MTNKEYSKLVSRHTPKVDHVKSMLLAFFVGGFIGMFGQDTRISRLFDTLYAGKTTQWILST